MSLCLTYRYPCARMMHVCDRFSSSCNDIDTIKKVAVEDTGEYHSRIQPMVPAWRQSTTLSLSTENADIETPECRHAGLAGVPICVRVQVDGNKYVRAHIRARIGQRRRGELREDLYSWGRAFEHKSSGVGVRAGANRERNGIVHGHGASSR